MSQELKACPFCGAIPDENDVGDYFVECPSCGITGPLGSKESLSSSAEAWNRRATDPRASKSNISEYVEMLIGKPDLRDEVIEKCRVALEEARGDVENALNLLNAMKGYPRFDRRIAERKQQLARHDEALAAIKELKR